MVARRAAPPAALRPPLPRLRLLTLLLLVFELRHVAGLDATGGDDRIGERAPERHALLLEAHVPSLSCPVRPEPVADASMRTRQVRRCARASVACIHRSSYVTTRACKCGTHT
eukprot:366443-Chlamydomonas_euryale.AAC.2